MDPRPGLNPRPSTDPCATRTIFIRHGQSTANLGHPCEDIALVPLTELGRRQAQELASRWTDTPNLIVTSPYTRARQTAQPTIDRFPHVPVEVWPVEEFTYLVPTRWNGTTFEERRPITENYWTTCDPDLCDGPGAESFSALLRRAEAALARLSSLPADSTALAFTHGQFMRAVRITVLYPGAGDLEKMQAFSADNTGIHNGGSLEFQFQRGRWSST